MKTGRPRKASTEPTLSQLGISRDQSAQWQKLAEIPEDQFEALLNDPKCLNKGGVPSTAAILRHAGMGPQREAQLKVEVYEAEGVVVAITAEEVLVEIGQQQLRWSR